MLKNVNVRQNVVKTYPPLYHASENDMKYCNKGYVSYEKYERIIDKKKIVFDYTIQYYGNMRIYAWRNT